MNCDTCKFWKPIDDPGTRQLGSCEKLQAIRLCQVDPDITIWNEALVYGRDKGTETRDEGEFAVTYRDFYCKHYRWDATSERELPAYSSKLPSKTKLPATKRDSQLKDAIIAACGALQDGAAYLANGTVHREALARNMNEIASTILEQTFFDVEVDLNQQKVDMQAEKLKPTNPTETKRYVQIEESELEELRKIRERLWENCEDDVNAQIKLSNALGRFYPIVAKRRYVQEVEEWSEKDLKPIVTTFLSKEEKSAQEIYEQVSPLIEGSCSQHLTDALPPRCRCDSSLSNFSALIYDKEMI